MFDQTSLRALSRILGSVDALRNIRAIYLMLCTATAGGLALGMAENALAANHKLLGVLWFGATITVAFYGINAVGLMLMDQARGKPVRELGDALRDALACAHRGLLVLAAVALPSILLLALLAALMWLVRLPWLGAPLFALLVPIGVLSLGLLALVGTVVVGPLTWPAVWDGASTAQVLRLLVEQTRHRLLMVALLVAAVSGLTAGIAAIVSFVVISGGRATALMAVWLSGIPVLPEQLMAGLFGYGLRSFGAGGAPVASSSHLQAAMMGGGVVFALALVLPALVSLRGFCAVYLTLTQDHLPATEEAQAHAD